MHDRRKITDEPWTARLEVSAGNDALRSERLARGLGADLEKLEGLTVRTVTSGETVPGSKGTVGETALLLAAAAPLIRPAADAVKAVLTGWLARDRRTVLKATVGDRSLEIIGEPSPAQQRALDVLLSPEQPPDEETTEP